MKPNNEEIIRIIAELQGRFREDIVLLIQNGVRVGSLHPIIEAFNNLDNMVRDLSEPAERHCESMAVAPIGERFYWQERAMKAEAELEHRRSLAQVVQPPESLAITEEMGH